MHSGSLQGDTFLVLLYSAFPVLEVLCVLDSSYTIACTLDVQSGQVNIFPNHKNSRLYTVFYKKSSCSDSRFRVFLFFSFYTLCIYIFISIMFSCFYCFIFITLQCSYHNHVLKFWSFYVFLYLDRPDPPNCSDTNIPPNPNVAIFLYVSRGKWDSSSHLPAVRTIIEL